MINRAVAAGVFALMVVAGACRSDSKPPLGPTACTLSSATAPLAAQAGLADLDALQRLLPNLPANSARDALSTALSALGVPLVGGLCATTQIAAAQAAAASYKASVQFTDAQGADFEGIQLALDRTQSVLAAGL